MTTLIAALVLLGVLITVHELGHFLVAKAAGVRVHVFSIGFGKALVKWQRGETEYRIAMLPFGGYVQMAGQDPLAERAPQDAGRSLLDKPPIVRILVFLAGPAMNLILPFAILVPLYGVGEAWRTVPSNTVGAVDAGMPAGLPGKLQAGDTIVAIDGEPVQAFWQTTRRMERYDATQGPLKLTVERGLDRAPVEVEVSPREWSETHSMLGYRTRSYKLGFIGDFLAGDVAVTRPDAPLAQAGVRTLDRILSVNGTTTPRYLDVQRALEATQPGAPVALEIERVALGQFEPNPFDWLLGGPARWVREPLWVPGDARETLCRTVPDHPLCAGPSWRFDRALSHSGERLDLAWGHTRLRLQAVAPEDRSEAGWGMGTSTSCIAWVDPSGPAGQARALAAGQPNGLKPGDCLLSINDSPHSLASFIAIKLGDRPDEAKTLKVRRDGAELAFILRPEMLVVRDPEFGESKHWDVGMMLSTRPDMTVPGEVVSNPDQLAYAWMQANREIPARIKETAFAVGGMFTGTTSVKQLSGPVTIVYLAGRAAEAGIGQFLQLMVVISLGLAIFNLLPVPGLDGGQIVMSGIELIMRRPAPAKVHRAVQSIGVMVILTLVVFVLINDVLRRLGAAL
jgi:regulator of sigma E protease